MPQQEGPGEGDPGLRPDRIFIGRVDLETREFIPKRYEVRAEIDLETMTVRGRRDLPRIPSCYLPLRDGVTS